MEHSLHLAVGHVLSRITPMQTKTRGVGNNNDDNESEAAASDDSSAIISHALRKLLGLIKQVRLILHIYYTY